MILPNILKKTYFSQNSRKKILIATYWQWNSSVKVGDHHYAELFAKNGWQVCLLSHTISPFHLLKRKNLSRFSLWLRGGGKEGNIFFYTPFTFLPYLEVSPFNNFYLGKYSLKFTFPSIKKILKVLRFNEIDILWINDISFYYLTEIVNKRILIQRITDDVTGWHKASPYIATIEREIAQISDIVLVTAKNLLDRIRKENKNVFWIPNGVDFGSFRKERFYFPAEYKKIKSPRIIYIGAIERWFDQEILAFAAKKLPLYNFILIGPVGVDLSRLKALKNVFILGTRPYITIPNYMKYADVGIIPFKKNPLIRSVSPIKMFEYLAAGLPVVATKMEEAQHLNPPVHFVDNPQEFVNYLKIACKKGKNLPEFIEFAKRNSWQSRFDKIQSLLK